jgi:uncharacterized protein YjiS (DUF1127 family)
MMTTTTYGKMQASGVRLPDIRQKAYADATSILDLAKCFYQRAVQRRRLAAMDDRMLQDIGISRMDASAEAAKPFWQA